MREQPKLTEQYKLYNVDYTLEAILTKQDCCKIKPEIIAVTKNDPSFVKKKKHAEVARARIKIIPYHPTHSSSSLIHLLGID